jgi:gamma-glutamylcyclotransferase (GGCT)/AIG2-like uncharacterized protein YtfP
MPAARNVFTYGTLLLAEVMEAVAGRRFASVPARLDGFERVRVRGAVYPGARAAEASIDGVLWLDVDEASLARLDRFEGDTYERRHLVVGTADGPRDAQAYVVPPANEHLLEPASWDLEGFRREHLARYLELCRAGDVAEDF